jgi:hypothetical protein
MYAQYGQIFQESIGIIRKNKAAWFFGFLSCLDLFTSSYQYVRGNIPLECLYSAVSLASWIFLALGEAGLIYTVHRALLKMELSIREGLARGKASLLRMIGLMFLLAPLHLGLFFFALIIWYRLTHSTSIWVVSLSVSVLFWPLITLGLCEIVVGDQKATHALWTSLTIYKNNFSYIAFLSGIFLIMFWLLAGLLILILFMSLYSSRLASLLALDSRTYQTLLGLPIFMFAGNISTVVVRLWSIIVITIAYQKFTGKISYPSLALSQEEPHLE